MRVLIGAFGTRGDVQPMVSLAKGLVERGHSVTAVVPPNSLAFSKSHGVNAVPVGLDYEVVSQKAASGSISEILKILPELRGEVVAQLAAMDDQAAKSDIIVGSSVFVAGSILSERHSIPYVYFAFCPQLFPSGDHANPSLKTQTLPRWINKLSWISFEWMWKYLLKKSLNRTRHEHQLPSIRNVWKSLTGLYPMVACDPGLAVTPSDHPIPVVQVGSLFLEDPGSLSPEAAAFLEQGEPPVYIGFGSMSDPNPTRTTQRLLESIRRAGVRAIVSRGWAGLEASTDQSNVLFVGPEPHHKLFPQCAAVVHHGGSGTTHAAARAGVPQIVMPQLLDQHYWAHRVQRTGLGFGSVKRHGPNPEPLAQALRKVVEDRSMRSRAEDFSKRMSFDGVEKTIQRLEQLVSSSKR